MGFLKFLSPVAMLFGGDEEDDQPQPQPQVIQQTAADPNAKTPEQIEKEKKQKLIAINAGQDTAFNPLAEEEETVTNKTLLGL